jgi:hypothetical protein
MTLVKEGENESGDISQEGTKKQNRARQPKERLRDELGTLGS